MVRALFWPVLPSLLGKISACAVRAERPRSGWRGRAKEIQEIAEEPRNANRRHFRAGGLGIALPVPHTHYGNSAQAATHAPPS
jgi:hypothetical protein